MHRDDVQDSLGMFKGLVDIIVERSWPLSFNSNLIVVMREDKPVMVKILFNTMNN